MLPASSRSFLLVAVGVVAIFCHPVLADGLVTSYPSSFFEKAQPYSAFDMLALVPGFRFSEADPEIRGFAGGAGNVLIDGSRPPTKQETLEALLRRINATAVDHIEVIRAGAGGIDMQGQTVLANVVRRQSSRLEGSIELAHTQHERGRNGQRVGAQLVRTFDGASLDVSVAAYEAIDDEHGLGKQPRIAPDGTVLRDTRYRQDESEQTVEFATVYQRQLERGELRVNGTIKDGSEGANIVEQRVFPDVGIETVIESEEERTYELGLDYSRELHGDLQFQSLAIQRYSKTHDSDRGFEDSQQSIAREDSIASESIVRAMLRRSGERSSLEGGIETALNILDSYSGLEEGGTPVDLPAAQVRVEELRTEAFATLKLRLGAAWALDTELRTERSTLTQSGDSAVEKTFTFVKPRLLLSWNSDSHDQVRLLLARYVGQLDFASFVSSSSLDSGTVTAGNPDLEPDRTSRVELAWERHFDVEGAVVLTLRHDEISDVIDRVPVAGADGLIDAVGNIGSGERNEVDLALSLPLKRLGIEGGMFNTSIVWRNSRTRDPATGQYRSISLDIPVEASAHLWQDVPSWRGRWGIDITYATEETEYRFDEVRTDRLGTRLVAFIEYVPATAWHLRLDAQNLTNRIAERTRRRHEGLRGVTPLAYTQTRSLWNGPFVSLTVRHEFGH